MVTDPIADLITQIKNGSDARKASIAVPFSKFKAAVLEKLLTSGFVAGFEKRGKKVAKFLDITLKYTNDVPEVRGVKRVSKLSKRVYLGAKEVVSIRHGHGVMILSTPKGVMTDREAREEKVGGEALFTIW